MLGGDYVTSSVTPVKRGALAILTPAETAGRKRRTERKAAIRRRELDGNPRPNTPRCGAPLKIIV
jgi:hypothetical protein